MTSTKEFTATLDKSRIESNSAVAFAVGFGSLKCSANCLEVIPTCSFRSICSYLSERKLVEPPPTAAKLLCETSIISLCACRTILVKKVSCSRNRRSVTDVPKLVQSPGSTFGSTHSIGCAIDTGVEVELFTGADKIGLGAGAATGSATRARDVAMSEEIFFYLETKSRHTITIVHAAVTAHFLRRRGNKIQSRGSQYETRESSPRSNPTNLAACSDDIFQNKN